MPDMPKVNANASSSSAVAFNESTRLLERIDISPSVARSIEARTTFSPSKKSKGKKPYSYPPVRTPVLTQERLAEIEERNEKTRLINRIRLDQAEERAHKSLLERLALRTPSPPPTTDTPLLERFTEIPEGLNFRKKKYSYRVREFQTLCTATVDRINPFVRHLTMVTHNERRTVSVETIRKMDAVEKELEKLDKWTEELLLWDTTTPSNYKMKLALWRKFRGACKFLGKVDFSRPEKRLEIIVDALATLYIPDPYEKSESA